MLNPEKTKTIFDRAVHILNDQLVPGGYVCVDTDVLKCFEISKGIGRVFIGQWAKAFSQRTASAGVLLVLIPALTLIWGSVLVFIGVTLCRRSLILG